MKNKTDPNAVLKKTIKLALLLSERQCYRVVRSIMLWVVTAV